MVHQVVESKVLVFPRRFTYTVKSAQCFPLSLRTVRSRLFSISPWSPAFPPASPPLVAQLCLTSSSVLCLCLTPQQRICQDCGHRPSLTNPSLSTDTAEVSRFSNIVCPRMLRFSDSAGPVYGSLPSAVLPCCLPNPVHAVGTPKG